MLEDGRAGQACLAKHVIEAAPDVVMDTTTAERLGDPVLDLLPECDRRRGRNPNAEIGFLHDDQATVLDEAADMAERRDRVGLIDQNESADDRVEAFGRREAVDGAFVEGDGC